MKICIIGLTHPFRGGISHYTTLFYNEIKKKHSVKLLSFFRLYPKLLFPGKTQFDDSVKQIEATNDRAIDSLNPLSWIKTFLKIKNYQPKLIVFQWWNPFLAPCYLVIVLLCRLFLKSKILFLCHNVLPHERSLIDRGLIKMLFLMVPAFIVHSSNDKLLLNKIAPGKPVFKSFHPIYDQFAYKGISKTEAKTGIDIDDNIILFFGYIRPYKGVKYLIESMPDILKEVKCRLVIAGEIYEKKRPISALIEKLHLKESVTLVDRYIPNEEVELYFAASDIVMLPYLSASQSGIIQIAYSFCKPVVATKVGGLPEVVWDNKTGYLVRPGDSSAISKAVIDFYKRERGDEFAKNIRGYKERFEWGGFVELILNFRFSIWDQGA